jgi:hypothetical protein
MVKSSREYTSVLSVRRQSDSLEPPYISITVSERYVHPTPEGPKCLVTLAAMLGHSKINMVMRYAHPTQEHQFAAMEKMQRYMIK